MSCPLAAAPPTLHCAAALAAAPPPLPVLVPCSVARHPSPRRHQRFPCLTYTGAHHPRLSCVLRRHPAAAPRRGLHRKQLTPRAYRIARIAIWVDRAHDLGAPFGGGRGAGVGGAGAGAGAGGGGRDVAEGGGGEVLVLVGDGMGGMDGGLESPRTHGDAHMPPPVIFALAKSGTGVAQRMHYHRADEPAPTQHTRSCPVSFAHARAANSGFALGRARRDGVRRTWRHRPWRMIGASAPVVRAQAIRGSHRGKILRHGLSSRTAWYGGETDWSTVEFDGDKSTGD
ncbi:hypothetical protein C8J57DRAFT_1470668, partial [Mycena rebaudengoi]